MPYGDVYNLRHAATVSTAISVLQLKAGTASPFQIVRASITQSSSTTSATFIAAFVRKSVAATVTAAAIGTHLFKAVPAGSTPDLSLGTAATGVIASAEGTDTDKYEEEDANVLNGWFHLPTPDSRIYVPVGGIIALKFTTAPASHAWVFNVTVREL